VASENQLADTFTKGLASAQFSILRQKLMGWSTEAREGVSRIDLTKYLWSLLGTERPVANDRAGPEMRQAHWWKNAKGPISREKATTAYDGCEQRLMRLEPD
jgi:hypothetical protein